MATGHRRHGRHSEFGPMGNQTAAPAALLFDVDGTLVDTYRLYLESYRRALAGFLGRAPSDTELLARKPTAEREFLSQWISDEDQAACHEHVCRHYAELHASHCEGMYDGVREMLAGLRSAGIPLGVVTGKGRSAWQITAAQLPLGDFDVVVVEEDVERPKPDPGGLLKAASMLGMPPGV